nr:ester cyclase [uncultured Dyadobacter sp.]
MRLLVEQIQDEASRPSANKAFILRFIRTIWNDGQLDRLGDFLHEDFIDYSVPIQSLQNRTGTKLYLKKLGSTFSHHTRVNKIVEYDDIIICDFTLNWRSGEGSGSFAGLRIFRIKCGKILHHWEVIH